MLYDYVRIFRELYGELYALFKDPSLRVRASGASPRAGGGCDLSASSGPEMWESCFRLALEDEDCHQTTGARGAARDVADGACVARERVALHTLLTGSGG